MNLPAEGLYARPASARVSRDLYTDLDHSRVSGLYLSADSTTASWLASQIANSAQDLGNHEDS